MLAFLLLRGELGVKTCVLGSWGRWANIAVEILAIFRDNCWSCFVKSSTGSTTALVAVIGWLTGLAISTLCRVYLIPVSTSLARSMATLRVSGLSITT